jgi:hypothetical protein
MADLLYLDSFGFGGDMSTHVPEIGVAYTDSGSSQSLSNLVISSGKLPIGTNNSHTYFFTQPVAMSGKNWFQTDVVYGVNLLNSGLTSMNFALTLSKTVGGSFEKFCDMQVLAFAGAIIMTGTIYNAAGGTLFQGGLDITSLISIGSAGFQLSMVITPTGVKWNVFPTEVINSGGIVCDRPISAADVLRFYVSNTSALTYGFLDSVQTIADAVATTGPATDALMFGSAF